jgi:hypothetical protein
MHELAAWLLDEIESTTELERLDMIGETIAHDKPINSDYLANPQVLKILRRAWGEKKSELLDTKTQAAIIADVVVENDIKMEPSGKPA